MTPARFRFGLFEFDAATLDLRRERTSIRLQRQPKLVLAYLLENPDRIVSRDELRKAIWGDETFVDFDRGLNYCIAEVRSALGDEATRSAFIRTVARQGYRFVAPVEKVTAVKKRPVGRYVAAMAVMASMAIGVFAVHGRRPTGDLPVIAVVRFDNETNDAAMTRFSDNLTDDFVERLTSMTDGQYAVVGNASILRGPREQRDLKAIAQSLHANFVILGQVQAAGRQTRILVHLIRMPDQTHLSVARLDRVLADPLALQAEAAQKAAARFAQKLTQRRNS